MTGMSDRATRPLREICDRLPAYLPEILGEWGALAREDSRLQRLADDPGGTLSHVVLGLMSAALCEPANLDAQRRCIQASADHGSARRRQGVPHETLFGEYQVMRHAIWIVLQRELHAGEAHRAINLLDMAVGTATRAAIFGYHRTELEERAEWAPRIEELVREARGGAQAMAAGEG